MENRIKAKIELIIDYIIRKPREEITLDDYEILASELNSIRSRKEKCYFCEIVSELNHDGCIRICK